MGVAGGVADILMKRYDEMKRLLDSIDSDSQCASEAIDLAKKAGVEIRKYESEERAREERERERADAHAEKNNQREYNLESQRISAISGIAKEYLRSQRPTYHYHMF